MIISDLKKKNYVILDTETTGIDENAEILQISIINEKNEVLLNEFVKPLRAKSWDEAEKINKISPKQVENKPNISVFSSKILDILNNADFIVGYNTSYDLRLLEQSGINLSKNIYDKSVDLMHEFALSQDNKIPFSNQLINNKLIDCAKYYGYSQDKNNSFHDSLEDCRATLFCFKAHTSEQLKHQSFISLEEIGKSNTFFNPSFSSNKFSPQLLKILDKLTDTPYLTDDTTNKTDEELEELIDFALYKYNKHHPDGPILEYDNRYKIVTCKDFFGNKYSLGSSHFSCPYCLPFSHYVDDISESFTEYKSLSSNEYNLDIKFDLKNQDFSLYATDDNFIVFNLDDYLKFTSINTIVDNFNDFAVSTKYTVANDTVCAIDAKNQNLVKIFAPEYFNLSDRYDYDIEDFENKGFVSLKKEDFLTVSKEILLDLALYGGAYNIQDLKDCHDCSNLFINKLNFLSFYTPDLSLLPRTDLEQIEKLFNFPKISNIDDVNSVVSTMDEDSFINLNRYLINHKLDDKIFDIEDKILCSAKDLQEDCTIQPQDKGQLIRIIKQTCDLKGWDCDLNFIDTSKITNMSCLFAADDIGFNLGLEKFNGDISKWDTSNVTNMSRMFFYAYSFNQPLNNWNTSNVEDMRSMFAYAKSFNQPLDNWNVLNVEDMSGMFEHAKSFNHPLDNWDVSNVKSMASMFDGATSFNQPLNNWNTSNVTDMSYIFCNASTFNQPIDNWDVSNVKHMKWMFWGADSFNQPLNNWNVSNVENMSEMFYNAKSFNQPLNNWNTANVTNMSDMFCYSKSFDQPLDNWNVSNVLDMTSMFSNADSFNQPLNNWNTSNVKRMSKMFYYAKSFNQPLNNWDTCNVKYMEGMFANATSFNQPLNNWNVSNVRDIEGMFSGADSFKSELPDYKNYKGTKEELLKELDLPPDYKSEIKKNQESYIVQPQTTEELAEIIRKICQEKGWSCDLNFIDANQVKKIKNNKVNHTDCDWIFNDMKDMIEDAVKDKVSLSDIVKCIATSGSYTTNNKKLKVTSAKLAVWLKSNGIKRKIHKRKSRNTKKESM